MCQCLSFCLGGCISNPDVSVTCHHYDPDNDSITPKDTVWLSWLSNGHYDVILDSVVENKQYDEWVAKKSRQLESDAELAEQLSHQDHTEVSQLTVLYDLDTEPFNFIKIMTGFTYVKY